MSDDDRSVYPELKQAQDLVIEARKRTAQAMKSENRFVLARAEEKRRKARVSYDEISLRVLSGRANAESIPTPLINLLE